MTKHYLPTASSEQDVRKTNLNQRTKARAKCAQPTPGATRRGAPRERVAVVARGISRFRFAVARWQSEAETETEFEAEAFVVIRMRGSQIV